MDTLTKETIEIVIEIICATVVLGLFSFVTVGYQIIPVLESLL